MEVYWKIVKEALPILILCTFGGVMLGLIMNNISLYIVALPGVLIIAPAVMSLTDSVLDTFNSRITSAIHSNKIILESFNADNSILIENILAILTITFIISIILGIVSHFVTLFVIGTSMGLMKFVILSLLTHLFAYITIILVSITIIFFSVKFKKDPDDIVSPLTPFLSDIVSLFFLLLFVKLITFL